MIVDKNGYSNDTTGTQRQNSFDSHDTPSMYSTATTVTSPTFKPKAIPEDEAFDHQSILSSSDRYSQKNLVRGASTSHRSGKSVSSTAYSDGKRLPHIDENDVGYGYGKHVDDHDEETSLAQNAAGIGMSRSGKYQDLEYADPPPLVSNRAVPLTEKATPLSRFMGSGKYPLQQRIEDKKRGIGRQRYPFVVWALSIAMVAVFIRELVLQSSQQGSPVSFKPVVNPMLGPSTSALINLGARYPPCMKLVTGAEPTVLQPCMNDTANPPDRLCTIESLCGFGGFHGEEPDQWFRFIVPIFLHAGFIHILLNLIAQLTVSAQIEREMGSGGFLITYFAAGIFGNVLGGNFSLVGAPSVGASGAIFGTIAVTWVDLFAHWKYQYRPKMKLFWMTVELAIGVAIGYIPYIDNFAHLGGFLMGLLVGTVFYPVISETKRHKSIMWGFRIACIPIAIVLFVVLIRNFYTSDPYAACSGCRYLSCFPTDANNHCKGTGLQTFGNATASS